MLALLYVAHRNRIISRNQKLQGSKLLASLMLIVTCVWFLLDNSVQLLGILLDPIVFPSTLLVLLLFLCLLFLLLLSRTSYFPCMKNHELYILEHAMNIYVHLWTSLIFSPPCFTVGTVFFLISIFQLWGSSEGPLEFWRGIWGKKRERKKSGKHCFKRWVKCHLHIGLNDSSHLQFYCDMIKHFQTQLCQVTCHANEVELGPIVRNLD